MARFWFTLAKMLVSPANRPALPNLRGDTLLFVAGSWKSFTSDRSQSASFLLLRRCASAKSLLRAGLMAATSEASPNRLASPDQISSGHPHIHGCRDELDLSAGQSVRAKDP